MKQISKYGKMHIYSVHKFKLVKSLSDFFCVSVKLTQRETAVLICLLLANAN